MINDLYFWIRDHSLKIILIVICLLLMFFSGKNVYQYLFLTDKTKFVITEITDVSITSKEYTNGKTYVTYKEKVILEDSDKRQYKYSFTGKENELKKTGQIIVLRMRDGKIVSLPIFSIVFIILSLIYIRMIFLFDNGGN